MEISSMILALLLVLPLGLVAVEYFMARMEDYRIGLIVPITALLLSFWMSYLGLVTSLLCFLVYFFVRHFKRLRERKLSELERMNIEDL